MQTLCHHRDKREEETSPGMQVAEVAARSARPFARPLFVAFLGGYSEPGCDRLQEGFRKTVRLDPGEAGMSETGIFVVSDFEVDNN
jgi:hypothetical protein